MAANVIPAPRFTKAELEAERKEAIRLFIEERKAEGDTEYRTTYNSFLPVVQRLFKATNNLINLDPGVLAADPELLKSLRFLCGPPISEDDLDTLVGKSVAKRKRLPGSLASDALAVLDTFIDHIRCPWIGTQRAPRRYEVDAAIKWTTGILAVEQLKTDRRTESAKRQQDAVRHLLANCGYQEVPPKDITVTTLDVALQRGQFSGEAMLGGNKCDVPVRLHDGRFLALECKVSNSALNSVKRLIRETGGKSEKWKSKFGEILTTGAVLAGVFKQTSLEQAQDGWGISIFWEHNLKPLEEFLKKAR